MPQQIVSLLPMVVIFGMMYFFLIRPQQKQRKERQSMLASLKKGDRVVTIGGIHGTLVSLKEQDIRLKVADNLELKMNRESVAYITKESKGNRSHQDNGTGDDPE